MLSEQEVLKLHSVINPADGNLWALPAPGSDAMPIPLTGEFGCEEFRYVRNASHLMFVELSLVEQGLAALVEWMEDKKCLEPIDSVLRLQASVSVTRRCAIEGTENIAADKKPT